MNARHHHGSLTRPRLVRSVAALSLVFTVLACSTSGGDSGSDAPRSESPVDTTWSFTDDGGTTVTLEATPDSIIAYEDVAATLLDLGIRPTGVFGTSPIEKNPLFEGYDMTGIESVGSVYGEINMEKAASLAPDVVISSEWGEYGPDNPPFGFLDSKQLQTMSEIAPVITLQALAPAPQVLDRYVELADALGSDLESPEMTAKRERYEQATERLRTAVAEHPEISVIGYDINSVGDGLFVAQAKGFPDLLGYQEDFGVTFVGPQSKKIIYWEKLSPEKTDTYLADIILYDSREPSLPLTELEQGLPLWNDLPAVQADQIVPWYVPGSGSYTRNAEAMELLAEAIENAQDVA